MAEFDEKNVKKTVIDLNALDYFYQYFHDTVLPRISVLTATTTIEAASSSNKDTIYMIPKAGTYAGHENLKPGDLLISDGTKWNVIPRADAGSGIKFYGVQLVVDSAEHICYIEKDGVIQTYDLIKAAYESQTDFLFLEYNSRIYLPTIKDGNIIFNTTSIDSIDNVSYNNNYQITVSSDNAVIISSITSESIENKITSLEGWTIDQLTYVYPTADAVVKAINAQKVTITETSEEGSDGTFLVSTGDTDPTEIKIKGLNNAAYKDIDATINGSLETLSENLPTSKAVVEYIETEFGDAAHLGVDTELGEESTDENVPTSKTVYDAIEVSKIAENNSYDNSNSGLIAEDVQSAIDETMSKIKDIELFKFPNATIIGTPTINNGQVSGFSASNYMKFPFIVNMQGRPFTIDIAFTTGTDITNQQNIIDGIDHGIAFAIRDGKFIIVLSSKSGEWDISNGEKVSGQIVTANTSYRIRLSWNGSVYTFEYSTNGESYTEVTEMRIASSLSLYPTQINIGVTSGLGGIFKGIINMNYCSLTISDKIVWTGMDDVGLATRMAVDMSNIDKAGENKVKSIIGDLPTKESLELNNVTNDKQVKGLSTGTTAGHLVSWGSDGYSVTDTGAKIISSDIDIDANKDNVPTAGAVKIAIDELKNSVSDGKSSIASAITTQGVTTESDATFATMAANIGTVATNKYNKGVSDTKVGTATAANVLSGKTFTNSSSVGVSGTMKDNGAVNASVGYDGTYTIPAGYHNGSGKVTSTVISGSFNNAATAGVTYTENKDASTVVPAEGALYINAGYIPNTKITLAHLIPDDVQYDNAGNAQIRSGYEAYSPSGEKLIGTIADVTPKFTGGTASLTGTSNIINTNMTTASSGDYYIDATAKAKATRTAVTYNGVATGYINVASGTSASAANTSAEGSIPADRVYLPTSVCTVAGGGLSKGTASGGGLSGGGLSGGGLTAGNGEVSVSNGTVTPSVGGSSITNASTYGITTTKPSSGTDGTNYLTFDPGASVTTNGTAKGRGSVSRAAVTRAKVDRAAFSQRVTRAAITDAHTAGYMPSKDAATAIDSTYTDVSLAAGSIAADSTTIGATSGTSNWSSDTSTNPTIAAGTNYYVPVVTATATAGTATASASIAKDPTASASLTRTGNIGTTTKPSGTVGTDYWTFTSSASAASGYSTASASATGGSASVGKGITSGGSATGAASGNKSATSTEKTASDSSSVYLVKAAGSVTMTAGSGSVTGSNVTLSDTNNGISVTGKGAVSATAKITTAGYTPTNNSFATGSSTNSNSATKYITAVTVPKDVAFSITTTSDTALDTTSNLTVTNAGNRRVVITNPGGGSVNITNSGLNDYTAGGSVLGTLTVNAYNNASSPALTGAKTVVSNGKWNRTSVGATSTTGTYYGAIDFTQPTQKVAATYNTSTSDQTIATGNYIAGTQTIKAVTTSNIDAGNIKKGVTVTVGDANSAGRIKNVTGTLDYIKTVTSVPSTKDTSIIYNSSTGKFYLWK